MNNDRFKFRVWWKKEKRYRTDVKITPIERFCVKEFIVEQCTGLRDINGNLIYAGDRGILTVFGGIGPNGGYVDSDKQVNAQVEWADECAGFYFVDDNGIYYDMTNSTEIFEIIGNIHEQKEQQ